MTMTAYNDDDNNNNNNEQRRSRQTEVVSLFALWRSQSGTCSGSAGQFPLSARARSISGFQLRGFRAAPSG